MAGRIVQAKPSEASSAGTTLALTFDGNVTAGNFLQIVATAATADTLTPAKSAGTATLGTITERASVTEAGTLNETTLFTAQVTGTGSLTLTCTWGVSQANRALCAAEIGGVKAFHIASIATDTGNNPTGIVSVNVTTLPAFGVLQGVDCQGGQLVNYGGGFTLAAAIGTSVDRCTVCITGLPSIQATGTLSGSFQNAGSDRNNSALVAWLETAPPAISVQPASQTAAVGGTDTFTVTGASVDGTGLTYQWRRNGTAIDGATGPSYTTPTLTAADNAAEFDCILTDSVGSTTSAMALLMLTGMPLAGVGRDIRSAWPMVLRSGGWKNTFGVLTPAFDVGHDTGQAARKAFADFWFASSVVTGTGATAQGQTIAATGAATTNVAGTGATAQGQALAGVGAEAYAPATCTTRQAQSVAGVGAEAYPAASLATGQGSQSIQAAGASLAGVTGIATTGQGGQAALITGIVGANGLGATGQGQGASGTGTQTGSGFVLLSEPGFIVTQRPRRFAAASFARQGVVRAGKRNARVASTDRMFHVALQARAFTVRSRQA